MNRTCYIAAAQIRGGKDCPELRGVVQFIQRKNGVQVTARVTGLPSDGFFAFHIHEGTCGGDAFADSGGHYNPGRRRHPYHAGDLPPLLSCGGYAWMSVLTNRFSVSEIVGRAVVIHAGVDDFTSQPAGNAGEKIACGRICAG